MPAILFGRREALLYMFTTTRRELLFGSMAMSLAASSATASEVASVTEESAAEALSRYAGYGSKASGGPGDSATADWFVGALVGSGFHVVRQSFSVPWFTARRAELICGDTKAQVIPQAIVVQTPADGVTGALAHFHANEAPQVPLKGALALITLPFGRWSTALSPAVRRSVTLAQEQGAVGAVLISTGPSSEATALNCDGERPMFDIPVAVLAPKDAAPFVAAAASRQRATLHLEGDGGRRDAVNVIGKIDRQRGRWLVISTPRSGWFDCVGERGPGVAVWLALARWAPTVFKNHDLAFVSASGHEYEYLGAKHLLAEHAPKPAVTVFWLHLGANVAARDWHEAGRQLLPLPSADPQRFLLTSEDAVGAARTAFRGLPGIENAYPAQGNSSGELADVEAAGYKRFAGIFGAHRFHHTTSDDLRCVDAAHVDAVIAACKDFLRRVV